MNSVSNLSEEHQTTLRVADVHIDPIYYNGLQSLRRRFWNKGNASVELANPYIDLGEEATDIFGEVAPALALPRSGKLLIRQEYLTGYTLLKDRVQFTQAERYYNGHIVSGQPGIGENIS